MEQVPETLLRVLGWGVCRKKENRCRVGAGSTVEERKLGIDVRKKVMRGTDIGGVVYATPVG